MLTFLRPILQDDGRIASVDAHRSDRKFAAFCFKPGIHFTKVFINNERNKS